jgi:hypothetical protein
VAALEFMGHRLWSCGRDDGIVVVEVTEPSFDADEDRVEGKPTRKIVARDGASASRWPFREAARMSRRLPTRR